MAPLTLRQHASAQTRRQRRQGQEQEQGQQDQHQQPLLDGADADWDTEAGAPGSVSTPLMTVPELLDAHPQHLVRFVKESGMRRLGTLRVRDLSVLSRFAHTPNLLTMGSDDADLDWESAWRRQLQLLPICPPDVVVATEPSDNTTQQQLPPCTVDPPSSHQPKVMWGFVRGLVQNNRLVPALATAGWAQEVALQAYVVNLWDPAAKGHLGLLHPLLARWLSGSCTLQVFGLPAVQKLLCVELTFYLLWLLSFTGFMMLLQQEDHSQSLAELARMPWGAAALALEGLACMGMLPFLFIEASTIAVYRSNWVSLWNVLDCATYGLQVCITVMYLTRTGGNYFTIAVALQCILLMVRLQYFLRAFRSTSFDFVSGLQHVLVDVRWYLGVMLLLMWGFACAFFSLFGRKEPQFATLPLAVLNMFSYAVGGATYYLDVMTKSETPLTATLLVIVYQLVVSMVLMSLLIGVITNSLAKVTANEHLRFLQSRVEIIDELEAVLPDWLVQRWQRGGGRPRYIYVLRVDPQSIEQVEDHYLWASPGGADPVAEAAEKAQAEQQAEAKEERAWVATHQTNAVVQQQLEEPDAGAGHTTLLGRPAAMLSSAVQQLLGHSSSSGSQAPSTPAAPPAAPGSSTGDLAQRIGALESHVTALHTKLDHVLALLGASHQVESRGSRNIGR